MSMSCLLKIIGDSAASMLLGSSIVSKSVADTEIDQIVFEYLDICGTNEVDAKGFDAKGFYANEIVDVSDVDPGTEGDDKEDDLGFFSEKSKQKDNNSTFLTAKEIDRLKINLLNLNIGAQSMGCVLHSLQNALKDALQFEEHAGLLKKVCKIVRKSKVSIKVMEALREAKKVLRKAVITRKKDLKSGDNLQ
jgi:hypothetical protein